MNIRVCAPGHVLISVYSCNFSSASFSCRFGSLLAPLLPMGMCTELTHQWASGAFGSGDFAAVPVFFMKQHQDQWLSLPSSPCWRLRRQESGLSEPNLGHHLGLTKPETRWAKKMRGMHSCDKSLFSDSQVYLIVFMSSAALCF